MSVPRNPVFSQITPRHNRLPHGAGLWWPLHSSLAGMPDTPSLTEIVTVGSAAAGKWTDDLFMYSLPTDNGNTNGVALLAPHDEDDNSIEQVIGLTTAAVGTQVLIGGTARWGDQADNFGWFWCYGINSTHSQIGLYLNSSETLLLNYRGKQSSNETALTLTLSAGTATTNTGWRGTDVQHVTSLYLSSALTATVEVRLGNGTLSAHYTGTATFSDNSGTAPPGRGTATASQHPGFMVGGRIASGPTATQLFGKGAGHSARYGNICARRFTTYDSGYALQAVTDLLARPDDYPASWLT